MHHVVVLLIVDDNHVVIAFADERFGFVGHLAVVGEDEVIDIAPAEDDRHARVLHGDHRGFQIGLREAVEQGFLREHVLLIFLDAVLYGLDAGVHRAEADRRD